MKSCYSIKLSPVRLAVADVCRMNGEWWITRINVPIEFRGLGHGRELLRRVLKDADSEEAVLRLVINPYGEMSRRQLRTWYERHGFVHEGRGLFVRRPGK